MWWTPFIAKCAYPQALFGILIEQTAELEISRKADIENTLDYISRQLEQIKIVDRLPGGLGQPNELVNRAMDVRSASMKYLTVHIRHMSKSFGVAGYHSQNMG